MAPGVDAQAIQSKLAKGEVVHALSVVEARSVRGAAGEAFARPDVYRDRSCMPRRPHCRTAMRACDFVTLLGEIAESPRRLHRRLFERQRQRTRALFDSRTEKSNCRTAAGAGGACRNRLTEFSRRKGALQSEQTELQASLQQAQTELRAQEVAIATREGEFNALENSHRLLHQKIDTVVYEIQSLAAQEQEGLQKARGSGRRRRRVGRRASATRRKQVASN